MSKPISASDLSAHNSLDTGLYIAIDGGVYDMTGFVDEHPGGAKILKRVGGKDASKQFWKYHNEGVLRKYQERLKIGTLEEKARL
ncbi:hypothetical protein MMC26_005007 [Xylographa opegraphella]|nr:hypothetical protein [Xylographa opegraphella]